MTSIEADKRKREQEDTLTASSKRSKKQTKTIQSDPELQAKFPENADKYIEITDRVLAQANPTVSVKNTNTV